MATQKEMAMFRADFIAAVQEIEVPGFEFAGLSVDGPVFVNVAGDAVVVKSIAKKEGFDVQDALAEWEEKEAARLEREAAKAEKAAARAAKEKAKEEEAE